MEKTSYNIEYIKQLAADMGGRCLSEEYWNDNEKLKFQCSKGHSWLANPLVVVQGGWCPQCAREEDKENKENIRRQKILETIKEKAIEKGGKCLTDVYVNNMSNLLMECAEGHQWISNGNKIQQGYWCPVCAGVKKYTIEQMREFASSKGGKFLSESYQGANIKHLWMCEKGHRWEAKPTYIFNSGHWCSVCAGVIKYTIADMKKIAKKKGGKCLSKEYDFNKKLLWECAKGHRWESYSYNVLKSDSWCPYCAPNKKDTIENMKTLAISRGGKCLSDVYVNSQTKLLWQCSKGHQWYSSPNCVKAQKHWCTVCSPTKKLTIEKLQELAKLKKGKCLSDVYINVETTLLWECEKGHRWATKPYNIIAGRWCPQCAREKNRTKQLKKESSS